MKRLANKKSGVFLGLLMGVSLFLSVSSNAEELPEDVLRASIDELIAEFSAKRESLNGDKSALYDLAESVLDENWDFSKMSRLVLGKNWKKATDTQKEDFTTAFKKLLIRTYSSAMFKYTGKENIVFEGTDYKGDKKNRATVSARGDLGDGSEPIPLSFSVYKDKAEMWRIYNIGVAGVSLVTTYRTSYNQIIRSKGLDGLISSIEAKVAS